VAGKEGEREMTWKEILKEAREAAEREANPPDAAQKIEREITPIERPGPMPPAPMKW